MPIVIIIFINEINTTYTCRPQLNCNYLDMGFVKTNYNWL